MHTERLTRSSISSPTGLWPMQCREVSANEARENW